MNSPNKGDFMIVDSFDHLCEHYIEFSISNMFEWDKNKNRANIEKHGIPFQAIYKLYLDPHLFQIVEQTDKWEKIDQKELEEKGVELNWGNLDPIRAKLIGMYNGKIHTAIYTFRGPLDGDAKYRIISLRRSDNKEELMYQKHRT